MITPLITALATQRLTQLITEDEVTRPYREKIEDWAGDAPEFSPRERLAYLVSCPACTSVWTAVLLLLAERSRVGRFAVRALALSGIALHARTLQERIDR